MTQFRSEPRTRKTLRKQWISQQIRCSQEQFSPLYFIWFFPPRKPCQVDRPVAVEFIRGCEYGELATEVRKHLPKVIYAGKVFGFFFVCCCPCQIMLCIIFPWQFAFGKCPVSSPNMRWPSPGPCPPRGRPPWGSMTPEAATWPVGHCLPNGHLATNLAPTAREYRRCRFFHL